MNPSQLLASFWDTYFPLKTFRLRDDDVAFATAFFHYFVRNYSCAASSDDVGHIGWNNSNSQTTTGRVLWTDRDTVELEYGDFVQGCEEVPALEAKLRQSPGSILPCLNLAAHAATISILRAQAPANSSHAIKPSFERRTVRLFNYTQSTPIKKVKANLLSSFLSIRGTVLRVAVVKPVLTSIPYMCDDCGEVQEMAFKEQPTHYYRVPAKCARYGCKSRKFTPQLGATVAQNKQRIWVREDASEGDPSSSSSRGTQARVVECELADEIVDSIMPGDVVTVSGVLKVVEGRKVDTYAGLYIDVNSIVKANDGRGINALANPTGNAGVLSKAGIAYTEADLYGIRQLAEDPNLFSLLVHSLCPAIYGHEVIKATLLLALFGGRVKGSAGAQEDRGPRNCAPDHNTSVSSDIHIMLVGDRGMGKSQMLASLSAVLPRGEYLTVGTSKSSPPNFGLSTTRLPDSGNDVAVEAGPLVLSDLGTCCVDNFEKCAPWHTWIAQTLDNGYVTLDGSAEDVPMYVQVPARTSLIVAANPVCPTSSGMPSGGSGGGAGGGWRKSAPGGSATAAPVGTYDRSKTVCENTRMTPAMLARFDLVFVILDIPEKEKDGYMARRVLDLHAGGTNMRGPTPHPRVTACTDVQDDASEYLQTDPLPDRLKHTLPPVSTLLPTHQLRAYIAYARTHVHPYLTPAAAAEILANYPTLHALQPAAAAPSRTLETVVKMAEARARSELREAVEVGDVRDVVELCREAFGSCAAVVEGPGAGLGKRKRGAGGGGGVVAEAQRFIAHLRQSAANGTNRYDFDELRQIAKAINIPSATTPNTFSTLLDTLNADGFLIKKGPRVYVVSG
ncbi:MCM2/3/5 family-domain-containing protein [Fimicolochytrium jonesii]|uniref:MCM2/3/5 family-domain-containing protein n=1 Tax=Fimicolochytrium jonesii TaxID=1396493 RepID=UPI0022FE7201|nr:MCM2/3/5 family-domain-containing protein [Fimicolochytrium jonesii]KAI8826185.1 MCM2/3/5 family-domain-containing protein [Fimicolochytrium jonesii]